MSQLWDPATERVVGQAKFVMPATVVEKGLMAGAEGSGPLSEYPDVMEIQGVISTDDEDMQGEVVDQPTLDFSYFKRRGWINDVHEKGTYAGVGYPVEVTQHRLPTGKIATKMRGILLHTPMGRRTYDVVKATSADDVPRKVGFSVQGPVLERNVKGKRLKRMLVTDVTITRHPINPMTSAEVVMKDLFAAAEKGMTVGVPLPSYVGGRSGAALVPQSLDAKVVRTTEDTMITREELEAMDPQDRADLEPALRRAGMIDAEPDGDGFQTRNKSVEAIMDEIREHVEAGGNVVLTQKSLDEIQSDGTGMLQDVAVQLDRVESGHTLLARAVMALGTLIEKSLEGTVGTESAERVATIEKSLDDIKAHMRIPQKPRAADPNGVKPVRDPSRSGGDDPVLDFGVVKKSLEGAYRAETDAGRKEAIAGLMLKNDGRSPIKASDLERVGVKVQ